MTRRGSTLVEVLGCVAVLAVVFGAGAQVFFRTADLGSDLIAYTRAVAAAERLMELRKAGQDPGPEAGRLGPGLSAQVRSERFRDTALTKVTVLVRWRASHSRRREIRLMGLVR